MAGMSVPSEPGSFELGFFLRSLPLPGMATTTPNILVDF